MSRADFWFVHRFRVRWAECDPQNIVFNAHYLTYFDVGMTEFFRAAGVPYPQALLALGCDTFLVKTTVDYKASARYDDELDLYVRVGRVGDSSIQVLFELYRGDDLLTTGENIYVNGDPDTHASKRVPDVLRNALLRTSA